MNKILLSKEKDILLNKFIKKKNILLFNLKIKLKIIFITLLNNIFFNFI